MFEIIMANFGFWFNFSVPVIIALYLVLTNKEYIWKEFGVQAVATLAFVGLIYTLLFSYSTDLIDENYYNGKIKSSAYYEEWTELVHYTESYSCGTSKSPRTCTRSKTRRDHHPAYYQIKTTLNESISIKRRDYLKTKREFGSKYVSLSRVGKVSIGDGNKYISFPSKIIPTSVGHSYENYVAAANGNVIHTKVPKENVQELIKTGKIREYPSLYKGIYGESLLNRFIDTTGFAKNPNSYLLDLNYMATIVGSSKQANPIIYITNEDNSFKDALSQAWNMGKKNDVTLVLGVNDSGDIVWSDTICFTNNTDFLVDMSSDFEGKNINTDKYFITSKMKSLIITSYIRKPMKEFEYLKENITLEWYWQLLIFVLNLALNGFITYKFMTNWNRKR